MMTEPIRLLLVDDHMVVRKGLVHVLSADPRIQVIAEAESGEEALYLCQKLKPDIVLTDIKMEGMGGIDAARMIIQHHQSIKVVGLSTFANEETISALRDAGVSGYLIKDISASDLLDALFAVQAGETVFPSATLETREEPQLGDAREKAMAELGQQQIRVLALMTKGLTNPEIAEYLGIATPTARYHVSAILRKLDVSSRSEAVALAIRENMVKPEDIP